MAVISINGKEFEQLVHSGQTVLVEFSAPWCVYCRRPLCRGISALISQPAALLGNYST